jgi:quercetin dioxygenase-like cupin family protein
MRLEIKRFETPDEKRTFAKGTFELITLGGITVGRATYEPGWKWSEHVGPSVGSKSCPVEHVVLVLAGRAAVAVDEGKTVEIATGDLAYVPPGHDSWVVGDEPYVSLHFLGVGRYAKA